MAHERKATVNLKGIWQLIRQSVSAWVDDYAPSMGAALAYYTIFSIAPLLIIVIAVAGFAFGREAVQGELASQLSEVLGQDGAQAIQGLIASASEPKTGLIAGLIGAVVLLLGATTVFGELQSSLDRIWRVPAAPKANGLWKLLRTRLLSFGLVLGLGFLLLVSLVISAALAALGSRWGSAVNGWEPTLQLLNLAVSFALEMGLFAMIYKLMPRARIAWRDVWIGAGVTALLFEVGKLLIGLYLGKSSVASGFGAAGSVVVLLVWVYYSAQIFLLGAEFTWVYAHHHGSKAGIAQPATAPSVRCRSGEADAAAADAASRLPPCEAESRIATVAGNYRSTAGAGAPTEGLAKAAPSRQLAIVRDHPLKGLSLVVTAGLIAGTLLARTLQAAGSHTRFRRRRWFA
jgi:membrane protein